MNILILNPILFTAEHNIIPKVKSIKDTMIYNMCLGFIQLGHNITLAAAEEYHRLQTYFESNDGYQIDVKIKMVLNGMGFGAETYERKISSFSGGEKTRLAIAKLLLEEPTLLILDEPTNHLDVNSRKKLYSFIESSRATMLIVSHDTLVVVIYCNRHDLLCMLLTYHIVIKTCLDPMRCRN